MVLREPEERVGNQEVRNLRTAVVENQRAPVRMASLAGVLMLIQARSVEVRKAESISRKMRRHPVENHADSLLVHVVHEEHEVLRRTVARGHRIVAGHLVAPGSVQRMLHQRHQLDVCIPHLLHIFRKHHGEFAIIVKASVLLLGLLPRAEVNLVDGHRRSLEINLLPVLHVTAVSPRKIPKICDSRGRSRAKLRRVGVRIGL